MASSSGGTTTTTLTSSGSEEELQQLMDERKRKRMISNRESARRSRMRKQKHLDELASQLSQLRKENNQMISSVAMTTQHYVNVENENRVLRAQVAELSHQLQSLNDLIGFMYPAGEEVYGGGGGGSGGGGGGSGGGGGGEFGDGFGGNSVGCGYGNYYPIVASADTFMY